MFDVVAKSVFSTLAGSSTLKQLASRYGMRNEHSFARRFVAGETVQEAIAAAKEIERQGLTVTLDLLGESVSSSAAASEATASYVSMIGEIKGAGISRNISLKLTQLGLDIDRATAIDNLRRVLDAADQANTFVRIDMENSPYTAQTLDTFETVWNLGYRNAGVVIQSYLRRSESDVRRVIKLGARIRLVKGAYREPRDIAYQQKSEVDSAYLELMKLLLREGTFPAIATHDPAMIAATRAYAAERNVSAEKFEFQMLYGIRRDLQTSLEAEGYGMRIYVPFGREWFPYFMRRLGERPANVGFVVKGVLAERRGN